MNEKWGWSSSDGGDGSNDGQVRKKENKLEEIYLHTHK